MADTTIVVLCEGNGETPLILLHGGTGGIDPLFAPLRNKFKTALWAVQMTAATPLESFESQAKYYFDKIKEKQPKGPYRLASFSASSVMLFMLYFMFEERQDDVVQFSLIDYFPTVAVAPALGGFDAASILRDSLVGNTDPFGLRLFCDAMLTSVVNLYKRDGTGHSPKRIQAANEIADYYHHGKVGSAFAVTTAATCVSSAARMHGFLVRLWTLEGNQSTVLEALEAWMARVKTPVTVYIASRGPRADVGREDMEEWGDLGVRRCLPGARLVYLEDGHFRVLGNDELVEDLQRGYTTMHRGASKL
ncbi:hypothetical protein CYLTODRAFT_490914 [Cylindrobasidium torrendii FP15055 ss-10]|uniref:Uncharacterized protein n=1 Tax=Cylindrobasidium torrendii FP15055 ss-10 TaxID=1314674 RepID=A0A0D7BA78_9AGAR|nr:hypothetical protein CYLTODRAFT_490914 [Cylindrobasidium torrendii FP15055 ss-10]